jgi:hypothetical protein
MSNIAQLSEKDMMNMAKALMREHKISRNEALVFIAEYFLNETCATLMSFKTQFKMTMDNVADHIDNCKYGFDVSTIDPYIRHIAKTEPDLKISLVAGSDLARQCAACRRRAGY